MLHRALRLSVLGSIVCLGFGCFPGAPPEQVDEEPPGEVDISKIFAPSVPNESVPAGATWARESIHPIEWTEPTDLGKVDATVTVSVSYDAGTSWTVLEELPMLERYYRWELPATGADSARIRITIHREDKGSNLIPLRHLVTNEVKLGPTQKKRYTWQKVAAEAPFGSRDGAGGVTFNGKMWLIGGWNGDKFPMATSNDVWSSVDGATWVQEKPNTFLSAETFDYTKDWEGRHYGGYAVYDNQMWIIGGDPNQGHYQTDVWSSTDGKKWTRRDIFKQVPRMVLVTNPASPDYGKTIVDETVRPVEESQFGRRALQITGVFNNKLFLMGGQLIEQYVNPKWPGAPGKAFNDVWTSTDGATWTQMPTTGPMWRPRGLVSSAVEHKGRFWLMGGGLLDDPPVGRMEREFNADVWSTTDGARWEQTVDKPPFSARIWHNTKVFDDRIWVINGYDGYEGGQGRSGDNLGDVWYSADGRNWYNASPEVSFVPRHAGTAWVHNGAIFVGSGNAIGADTARPTESKWFADVWKMTPAP